MNYPTQHLFISAEWTSRAAILGLARPEFVIQKVRGLKLAHLRRGLLEDFEEWPSDVPSTINADWIAYRKLLPERVPNSSVQDFGRTLPCSSRPFVAPYSISPFLDLTKPLNGKKSAIAHIRRTERKLAREIGAPELKEFSEARDRERWFGWFSAFQEKAGRLTEDQLSDLKTWTLGAEKPEWMKLMALMVGETPLAVGLFYFWDGVFYYYSSSMNPDSTWRKYGPGKLFIEKLIAHALRSGAHTFDFLQGDHHYKSHWNPETRILYQCIVPRSLKGACALALFRLRARFRRPVQKQTSDQLSPGLSEK